MRIRLLIVLLLILTFITSCDEDFDLTAPYKDITVVYGLLNRKDTTHYIRIQKVFLGDENALLYAAISDSLYYPASLKAYILGFNSNGIPVTTDSFYLERTINEVEKDSGIFAAHNNVLYKGDKILDPNHTYKLIIIKPNGDTTWAITPIASNINMIPAPVQLDWEPNVVGVQTQHVKFVWALDPSLPAYQVSLLFHYDEWKVGSPANVSHKTAVRNFNMFIPTEEYICNINQVCFEVDKQEFYEMITNNIEKDADNTLPNNIRIRHFISLDVVVTVGATELYNYIKYNGPSLSFVQKINSYTNIHNGLGIFSSRTQGGYKGLQLHPQTLDSLKYGQYTKDLHFQ